MVLGSINGVNGATADTFVGIGTTAPAAKLDVHGTANFTGPITFAAGQTFPGTGTITGVTPGTDLLGGGTSGNVTLSLDISKVPQLNTTNSFTGDETFNGNMTVNRNMTTGSILANTVTAPGPIGGETVNAANAFNLSGLPFAFGSYSNHNAYLGYAANGGFSGSGNTATGADALFNATGSNNTANGSGALSKDDMGGGNTAIGALALNANTEGSSNTAVGASALVNNTMGSSNTALGYQAGPDIFSSTNLQNATAIGANADVTQSNSLVLGSINNINNATADTNVGIGTTAPQALLHINHLPPSGGQDVLLITNGASADVASLALQVTPSIRLREGIGTSSAYLSSTTNLELITGDTGSPSHPAAPALSIDTSGNVFMPKGKVGIGTSGPDALLTVNGSADKPSGGSWGTYSDGRLKNVHGDFSAGLSQVLKLHPVRYSYKKENAMGIQDFDEHVGFVAQDVKKVIPEAVTENNKGYLLVNNDPILWTMLNAIKEQQREIRQQQQVMLQQRQQIREQQQARRCEKSEMANLRAQMRRQAAKDALLESRLAQLERNQDKPGSSVLANLHGPAAESTLAPALSQTKR